MAENAVRDVAEDERKGVKEFELKLDQWRVNRFGRLMANPPYRPAIAVTRLRRVQPYKAPHVAMQTWSLRNRNAASRRRCIDYSKAVALSTMKYVCSLTPGSLVQPPPPIFERSPSLIVCRRIS